MVSQIQARQIAEDALKKQKIKTIEEKGMYYIVVLDEPDGAFDAVHMIDRTTGEMQPYNPVLIKGDSE